MLSLFLPENPNPNLDKRDPVYIDELAEICDVISVSAGTRGLQILLAPEDYIRAVKARVVAMTKREATSH